MESTVEEVKNAALSVLQEAEIKITSLQALVATKENQLEEAREQLFRMRQFEIEAGQWKSRATTLEKLVLELSEERKQLLERVKHMDSLQTTHTSVSKNGFHENNKLRIMEPIFTEILPLICETKEVLPVLRVCHYPCISMPNDKAVDSGHWMMNEMECRHLDQKRYSCSSVTSDSGSVSPRHSPTPVQTLDKNSEECIRLTSFSQTLETRNDNDASKSIGIASFYALHSSLMIVVGKFILKQLEKHTWCWNGMRPLSIEDPTLLKRVVNNMLFSWNVSDLAKYELYDGKWIPCFRNIWKQVVLHFDSHPSIVSSEHFLFFGIILFCCYFNWKAEHGRRMEERDCTTCCLEEECHKDENTEMKVKRRSTLASHHDMENNELKYLSIRTAMESIIHQLIIANDKAVRKCRYWKKQAEFHEQKAFYYQGEVSQLKARLSACNLEMLQWKNGLCEMKEKLIQLQQVKCDLSKETLQYKNAYCNMEELFNVKLCLSQKSTRQYEDKLKTLELENEKYYHERTKWLEERNTYESNIRRLQVSIEHWETQVKRLQDSLNENENIRKQLENCLVELEQREGRAKTEYKELLERHEQELSKAYDRIDELRIEWKQTEQQLAESRKRECLLDTKVDTLQQALESTKDELVVQLVDTKIRLAQSYEEVERLRQAQRKRSVSGAEAENHLSFFMGR